MYSSTWVTKMLTSTCQVEKKGVNLKAAGKAALNMLTSPQFTTFILLTWIYQIGLDLLMTINKPSWMDVQIWVDFGKLAAKDTLILVLAAVSKILKSAFQKEGDEIRSEMTIVSKATLSLMNKALISNDPEVREYAIGMGVALVGQGVSLYDSAFKGNVKTTDAAVSKVIDEMQSEAKK